MECSRVKIGEARPFECSRVRVGDGEALGRPSAEGESRGVACREVGEALPRAVTLVLDWTMPDGGKFAIVPLRGVGESEASGESTRWVELGEGVPEEGTSGPPMREDRLVCPSPFDRWVLLLLLCCC